MKNLVIHPEDPSTTFLKPIYEKISDKVVIEKESCPLKIINLIEKSNRIIAMGHGSIDGLFAIKLFSPVGNFPTLYTLFDSYAISKKHADILRSKDQNVYIWCHANKFVDSNNLSGFYSGMFVSEVSEALFCGINATQEMVDESNNLFSKVVGEYIDLPKEELYAKVVEEYGKLKESNPVAAYNLERLSVR